jgi:hypothetical protein
MMATLWVFATACLVLGLLCFRKPHRRRGLDGWAVLGALLVAFGGELALVLSAVAGGAL